MSIILLYVYLVFFNLQIHKPVLRYFSPNMQPLKKKKNGSFSPLDFKAYYEAIEIRTLWYWDRGRFSDQ